MEALAVNIMGYEYIKITNDYVDEEFENKIKLLVPELPKSRRERNQILRWGSSSPYKDSIVSSEIPEVFDRFIDVIDFDSVTVNEYYPGQTIDWHIDQPLWLKSVYIISLLSDADLKFKKDNEVVSFHLPRYSLVEFSGDLRYKWKHSLTATSKRYSVVFRSSKKDV